MEILVGASLIAAFVAGVAALFAPCCITVLLPAYLGSVFAQKRTVFLMTFVFFLGLLTVFLPLGLGVAALGGFFSRYHDPLFILGGLLLLFLSALILLGQHFSLPLSVPSMKTSRPAAASKINSPGSVFSLGVFSGFATLCCAPVLAGVLALSVLPGSLLWGGLYALTYALGMVSPLFFLAYLLDRVDFTKKFAIFRKPVSYSFLGRAINLTVADLMSGMTFLSMGTLILYLASTGQLAVHSSYQMKVNVYSAQFINLVNQYLIQMPAVIWITVAFVFLLLFVGVARRRKPDSKVVEKIK